MSVKPVLVWDVPTRLFHWLLVLGIAVAWLTSESDRALSLHAYCGYAILGLVAFRMVWGFIGGRYARFSAFAFGPSAAFAYLRELLAKRAPRYLSHNPAGSWAVYILVSLILGVCLTGVFTLGGEEQQRLTAGWFSVAAGVDFRQAHELMADALLVVIGVHLAGVAVDSWYTRENLPRAMLSGFKDGAAGAADSRSFRWVGAVVLIALFAFTNTWFFYAWRHSAARDAPRVAFVGPRLLQNAQWSEECGACHLAFHPSLLPARSWQQLLANTDQHFGTDLALEPATRDALLAFAAANAAEKSDGEAPFKINRSIPTGVTPLRITQTPYWVAKHSRIKPADWLSAKVRSRANCAACHVDADAGTFNDSAMSLPR